MLTCRPVNLDVGRNDNGTYSREARDCSSAHQCLGSDWKHYRSGKYPHILQFSKRYTAEKVVLFLERARTSLPPRLYFDDGHGGVCYSQRDGIKIMAHSVQPKAQTTRRGEQFGVPAVSHVDASNENEGKGRVTEESVMRGCRTACWWYLVLEKIQDGIE